MEFQRKGIVLPLLSKRGILALAIGAIIPLLGLVGGVDLTPTLVLLTLYLAALTLRLIQEYIDFYRALRTGVVELVYPRHLFSGEEVVFKFKLAEVQNHCVFELRLLHPPGVKAEKETVKIEGNGSASISFIPLERGVKEWQELFVRSSSRDGLLMYQWRMLLEDTLSLVVLPNYHGAAEGSRSSVQLGAIATRRALFSPINGREFHALREYAVGDDLRRVDWRRSARGESLYVREYVPESHQRLAVAIDCGRTMATTAEGRLLIEYATDGAAVLAKTASSFQDDVSILAFNHQLLARVPFGRGHQHDSLIINELVRLEVGELESDYELFSSWARALGRRSLVVLISGVTGAARIENLRMRLLSLRGRHLPLVVFMRDREIRRVAEGAAGSMRGALRIAAAIQYQRDVEQQIGVLSRSGVECLHIEPREISSALEERYRYLKQLGKI